MTQKPGSGSVTLVNYILYIPFQVITFNDKKCSLGSVGMAQITVLKNQVCICYVILLLFKHFILKAFDIIGLH